MVIRYCEKTLSYVARYSISYGCCVRGYMMTTERYTAIIEKHRTMIPIECRLRLGMKPRNIYTINIAEGHSLRGLPVPMIETPLAIGNTSRLKS